ncbi:hypothetical protein [Paenibacillus vini]|uniref:hypothetical protein n=1 Tax=Paenibacillus TaxID=44249 RepID=UPI00338DA259
MQRQYLCEEPESDENSKDRKYSFAVPGASNVKYAISYTTGGQTYWDNNYGHNYEVH